MQSSNCLGHEQRDQRANKIKKMLKSSPKILDDPGTHRVLIKKGPISVKTSLLCKQAWVEGDWGWRSAQHPYGGVQDDQSSKTRKNQKKGRGAGNQIESYPAGQTIKNLNEQIMAKYKEEKEKAKTAGKSKADAESAAQTMAKKLPEFTAVQKWQDNGLADSHQQDRGIRSDIHKVDNH